MTQNNIPNKPAMLAPDSFCIGMTSNGSLPVVSFHNSVTMIGNTNSPPLASSAATAAATNTTQASSCTKDYHILHETAQETCDQSSMTHQCDGPPQLISSREDTSGIQPFHHGDTGEQIQQEVEVSKV